MSNNTEPIGYKLPALVTVEEELACTIVYYPDQPEYRQALMGALLHFGTWTAWERDAAKRGRLAAKAWKTANELTMECLMANCFDDVIEAIKSLQTTVSVNCYCDHLTIDPVGEPITPPIIGIGDVPTTYGEDDTTGMTWTEYQALICSQAHAYVDYLKAQNDHLMSLLSLGILALGVVGALLAVMSGFGIAVLVSLGSAALIFQALIASPGASVFATVSGEIEAARAEIVDAIVCGTQSLRSAMEGAINSTAYDLFYQWVNWEAATQVLRTGQWEGETLEHLDASLDCPCASQYFQLVYHFEVDASPWTLTNTSYSATQEAIQARMDDTGGSPRFSIGRDVINQELGRPITELLEIVSVQCSFRNSATSACNFNNVNITVDTSLLPASTIAWVMNGAGYTKELTLNLDPPYQFTNANDFVQINMLRPGAGNGCGNPAPTYVYADYVIITGRMLA